MPAEILQDGEMRTCFYTDDLMALALHIDLKTMKSIKYAQHRCIA